MSTEKPQPISPDFPPGLQALQERVNNSLHISELAIEQGGSKLIPDEESKEYSVDEIKDLTPVEITDDQGNVQETDLPTVIRNNALKLAQNVLKQDEYETLIPDPQNITSEQQLKLLQTLLERTTDPSFATALTDIKVVRKQPASGVDTAPVAYTVAAVQAAIVEQAQFTAQQQLEANKKEISKPSDKNRRDVYTEMISTEDGMELKGGYRKAVETIIQFDVNGQSFPVETDILLDQLQHSLDTDGKNPDEVQQQRKRGEQIVTLLNHQFGDVPAVKQLADNYKRFLNGELSADEIDVLKNSVDYSQFIRHTPGNVLVEAQEKHKDSFNANEINKTVREDLMAAQQLINSMVPPEVLAAIIRDQHQLETTPDRSLRSNLSKELVQKKRTVYKAILYAYNIQPENLDSYDGALTFTQEEKDLGERIKQRDQEVVEYTDYEGHERKTIRGADMNAIDANRLATADLLQELGMPSDAIKKVYEPKFWAHLQQLQQMSESLHDDQSLRDFLISELVTRESSSPDDVYLGIEADDQNLNLYVDVLMTRWNTEKRLHSNPHLPTDEEKTARFTRKTGDLDKNLQLTLFKQMGKKGVELLFRRSVSTTEAVPDPVDLPDDLKDPKIKLMKQTQGTDVEGILGKLDELSLETLAHDGDDPAVEPEGFAPEPAENSVKQADIEFSSATDEDKRQEQQERKEKLQPVLEQLAKNLYAIRETDTAKNLIERLEQTEDIDNKAFVEAIRAENHSALAELSEEQWETALHYLLPDEQAFKVDIDITADRPIITLKIEPEGADLYWNSRYLQAEASSIFKPYPKNGWDIQLQGLGDHTLMSEGLETSTIFLTSAILRQKVGTPPLSIDTIPSAIKSGLTMVHVDAVEHTSGFVYIYETKGTFYDNEDLSVADGSRAILGKTQKLEIDNNSGAILISEDLPDELKVDDSSALLHLPEDLSKFENRLVDGIESRPQLDITDDKVNLIHGNFDQDNKTRFLRFSVDRDGVKTYYTVIRAPLIEGSTVQEGKYGFALLKVEPNDNKKGQLKPISFVKDSDTLTEIQGDGLTFKIRELIYETLPDVTNRHSELVLGDESGHNYRETPFSLKDREAQRDLISRQEAYLKDLREEIPRLREVLTELDKHHLPTETLKELAKESKSLESEMSQLLSVPEEARDTDRLSLIQQRLSRIGYLRQVKPQMARLYKMIEMRKRDLPQVLESLKNWGITVSSEEYNELTKNDDHFYPYKRPSTTNKSAEEIMAELGSQPKTEEDLAEAVKAGEQFEVAESTAEDVVAETEPIKDHTELVEEPKLETEVVEEQALDTNATEEEMSPEEGLEEKQKLDNATLEQAEETVKKTEDEIPPAEPPIENPVIIDEMPEPAKAPWVTQGLRQATAAALSETSEEQAEPMVTELKAEEPGVSPLPAPTEQSINDNAAEIHEGPPRDHKQPVSPPSPPPGPTDSSASLAEEEVTADTSPDTSEVHEGITEEKHEILSDKETSEESTSTEPPRDWVTNLRLATNEELTPAQKARSALRNIVDGAVGTSQRAANAAWTNDLRQATESALQSPPQDKSGPVIEEVEPVVTEAPAEVIAPKEESETLKQAKHCWARNVIMFMSEGAMAKYGYDYEPLLKRLRESTDSNIKSIMEIVDSEVGRQDKQDRLGNLSTEAWESFFSALEQDGKKLEVTISDDQSPEITVSIPDALDHNCRLSQESALLLMDGQQSNIHFYFNGDSNKNNFLTIENIWTGATVHIDGVILNRRTKYSSGLEHLTTAQNSSIDGLVINTLTTARGNLQLRNNTRIGRLVKAEAISATESQVFVGEAQTVEATDSNVVVIGNEENLPRSVSVAGNSTGIYHIPADVGIVNFQEAVFKEFENKQMDFVGFSGFQLKDIPQEPGEFKLLKFGYSQEYALVRAQQLDNDKNIIDSPLLFISIKDKDNWKLEVTIPSTSTDSFIVDDITFKLPEELTQLAAGNQTIPSDQGPMAPEEPADLRAVEAPVETPRRTIERRSASNLTITDEEFFSTVSGNVNIINVKTIADIEDIQDGILWAHVGSSLVRDIDPGSNIYLRDNASVHTKNLTSTGKRMIYVNGTAAEERPTLFVEYPVTGESADTDPKKRAIHLKGSHAQLFVQPGNEILDRINFTDDASHKQIFTLQEALPTFSGHAELPNVLPNSYRLVEIGDKKVVLASATNSEGEAATAVFLPWEAEQDELLFIGGGKDGDNAWQKVIGAKLGLDQQDVATLRAVITGSPAAPTIDIQTQGPVASGAVIPDQGTGARDRLDAALEEPVASVDHEAALRPPDAPSTPPPDGDPAGAAEAAVEVPETPLTEAEKRAFDDLTNRVISVITHTNSRLGSQLHKYLYPSNRPAESDLATETRAKLAQYTRSDWERLLTDIAVHQTQDDTGSVSCHIQDEGGNVTISWDAQSKLFPTEEAFTLMTSEKNEWNFTIKKNVTLHIDYLNEQAQYERPYHLHVVSTDGKVRLLDHTNLSSVLVEKESDADQHLYLYNANSGELHSAINTTLRHAESRAVITDDATGETAIDNGMLLHIGTERVVKVYSEGKYLQIDTPVADLRQASLDWIDNKPQSLPVENNAISSSTAPTTVGEMQYFAVERNGRTEYYALTKTHVTTRHRGQEQKGEALALVRLLPEKHADGSQHVFFRLEDSVILESGATDISLKTGQKDALTVNITQEARSGMGLELTDEVIDRVLSNDRYAALFVKQYLQLPHIERTALSPNILPDFAAELRKSHATAIGGRLPIPSLYSRNLSKFIRERPFQSFPEEVRPYVITSSDNDINIRLRTDFSTFIPEHIDLRTTEKQTSVSFDTPLIITHDLTISANKGNTVDMAGIRTEEGQNASLRMSADVGSTITVREVSQPIQELIVGANSTIELTFPEGANPDELLFGTIDKTHRVVIGSGAKLIIHTADGKTREWTHENMSGAGLNSQGEALLTREIAEYNLMREQKMLPKKEIPAQLQQTVDYLTSQLTEYRRSSDTTSVLGEGLWVEKTGDTYIIHTDKTIRLEEPPSQDSTEVEFSHPIRVHLTGNEVQVRPGIQATFADLEVYGVDVALSKKTGEATECTIAKGKIGELSTNGDRTTIGPGVEITLGLNLKFGTLAIHEDHLTHKKIGGSVFWEKGRVVVLYPNGSRLITPEYSRSYPPETGKLPQNASELATFLSGQQDKAIELGFKSLDGTAPVYVTADEYVALTAPPTEAPKLEEPTPGPERPSKPPSDDELIETPLEEGQLESAVETMGAIQRLDITEKTFTHQLPIPDGILYVGRIARAVYPVTSMLDIDNNIIVDIRERTTDIWVRNGHILYGLHDGHESSPSLDKSISIFDKATFHSKVNSNYKLFDQSSLFIEYSDDSTSIKLDDDAIVIAPRDTHIYPSRGLLESVTPEELPNRVYNLTADLPSVEDVRAHKINNNVRLAVENGQPVVYAKAQNPEGSFVEAKFIIHKREEGEMLMYVGYEKIGRQETTISVGVPTETPRDVSEHDETTSAYVQRVKELLEVDLNPKDKNEAKYTETVDAAGQTVIRVTLPQFNELILPSYTILDAETHPIEVIQQTYSFPHANHPYRLYTDGRVAIQKSITPISRDQVIRLRGGLLEVTSIARQVITEGIGQIRAEKISGEDRERAEAVITKANSFHVDLAQPNSAIYLEDYATAFIGNVGDSPEEELLRINLRNESTVILNNIDDKRKVDLHLAENIDEEKNGRIFVMPDAGTYAQLENADRSGNFDFDTGTLPQLESAQPYSLFTNEDGTRYALVALQDADQREGQDSRTGYALFRYELDRVNSKPNEPKYKPKVVCAFESIQEFDNKYYGEFSIKLEEAPMVIEEPVVETSIVSEKMQKTYDTIKSKLDHLLKQELKNSTRQESLHDVSQRRLDSVAKLLLQNKITEITKVSNEMLLEVLNILAGRSGTQMVTISEEDGDPKVLMNIEGQIKASSLFFQAVGETPIVIAGTDDKSDFSNDYYRDIYLTKSSLETLEPIVIPGVTLKGTVALKDISIEILSSEGSGVKKITNGRVDNLANNEADSTVVFDGGILLHADMKSFPGRISLENGSKALIAATDPNDLSRLSIQDDSTEVTILGKFNGYASKINYNQDHGFKLVNINQGTGYDTFFDRIWDTLGKEDTELIPADKLTHSNTGADPVIFNTKNGRTYVIIDAADMRDATESYKIPGSKYKVIMKMEHAKLIPLMIWDAEKPGTYILDGEEVQLGSHGFGKRLKDIGYRFFGGGKR